MTYQSFWTDLRNTTFSQGWLQAGPIRTRYLASGADDLPVLILLHGTGGHAEAYTRNLGAHAPFFRTYSIDMVGHGWTDKPDVQMDIAAYVDHLLKFIDALGVERAHISGESLGGWVAAQFAVDHPDRVDRLVLNTTGGSAARPEVMAKIKEISMRAIENPTWEFIKARLEWLMADPSKVTDDLIEARRAIYANPEFGEAMKRALILQEMDVRQRNLLSEDDWGAIAAETLVLWTSHDPTNPPEEGKRIASMIPNSQFVVMQDCGHWPQFEDPETFNDLHARFLRGENVSED